MDVSLRKSPQGLPRAHTAQVPFVTVTNLPGSRVQVAGIPEWTGGCRRPRVDRKGDSGPDKVHQRLCESELLGVHRGGSVKTRPMCILCLTGNYTQEICPWRNTNVIETHCDGPASSAVPLTLTPASTDSELQSRNQRG